MPCIKRLLALGPGVHAGMETKRRRMECTVAIIAYTRVPIPGRCRNPPPRFRVSGFGFVVSGFGFRVSGFGFRVSGFGFRVSGLKVYHDEVGDTAARLACPIQEDHLVHKPPGLGAKGTQVTSERDGSSALHVSRPESVSPS
jgi:hypothetical protein